MTGYFSPQERLTLNDHNCSFSFSVLKEGWCCLDSQFLEYGCPAPLINSVPLLCHYPTKPKHAVLRPCAPACVLSDRARLITEESLFHLEYSSNGGGGSTAIYPFTQPPLASLCFICWIPYARTLLWTLLDRLLFLFLFYS